MKNKFNISVFIFILFVLLQENSISDDDFIFESKSIELIDNGNIIKADNNVEITTNNGLKINSKQSTYSKITKKLLLIGDVVVFDKKNNITLHDHYISKLENIYFKGDRDTIRKDIEKVLTPYGFRNKNDNYFKAIFKIIFFYLNVPKFPNAHVRATGFLIHANDFITFMKNKIVRTKLQSFLIESGYNGLSNFFIRKKYKIFIINKNGKKFNLKNMRDSLTFAYGKQNKYLISDNHIRNYLRLSIKDKLKRAKQTWGKKF